MILQPYDIEVGAGTFHPGDDLARARARALGRRLRPAVAAADRRPLRREPEPAAALLSVPGHPEAVARRPPGALSREPLRRSASIRGRTTSASSRTTGRARPWAPGASAGRSGATAWRSSQFTYFQQVGGIDCRPVSGELTYGLERLAMYVQGVENVYDLDFNGQRLHLRRRLPAGRAGIFGVQFRGRRHRAACSGISPTPRRECQPASWTRGAGAAGLRPVPEGRATVQSPGCARRDQRHRAGRLYRPGARARARPAAEAGSRAARPHGRPGPEAMASCCWSCSPRRSRRGCRSGRPRICRRLRRRRAEGSRDRPFDAGSTYATPRRLALVMRRPRRPAARPSRSSAGGRGSARRPQALSGFLRGARRCRLPARGAGRQEGRVLFALIRERGRAAADVLCRAAAATILARFPWPKSMRWGAVRVRWVRPLHVDPLPARWRGRAVRASARCEATATHARPSLPGAGADRGRAISRTIGRS